MDLTFIPLRNQAVPGRLTQDNRQVDAITGSLEIRELTSTNRLYKLTSNGYYFEYRARGFFRWLTHLLKMNTWIELPVNIICKCELKYGFWLKLTTQEYSSVNQQRRTRQLTPIFIPSYRLAKKCKKLMTAIVNWNMTCPNPEISFINLQAQDQVINHISIKKPEPETAQGLLYEPVTPAG